MSRKSELISKEKRAELDFKSWENFNSDPIGKVVRPLTIEGKKKQDKSLTHSFFKYFNLYKYLKSDYIFQLGASTGQFLGDLKQQGKKVTGYDYSPEAIKELEKNATARLVDLNAIDQHTKKLSYRDTLLADLKEPANIVAVRTLEHLQMDALVLLLHDLIQNAPIGTVFFFVQLITTVKYSPSNPEHFDILPFLPINYVYSFFAPRTDMQALTRKIVDTSNKPMPNIQFFDELLVVTKIEGPRLA